MILRTDIINMLFLNYNFKTYLEIGVRNPNDNYNIINAAFKYGVDPNPNGKYTYNMTSDEFFKNHVGEQKYDIIFIDGLHTYEQSYRDAINSTKHISEDGFIVMHDCNPPDEANLNLESDNGMVFKTIIRLKQELKDWCCFVIDEDFGCGILTRRKILENRSLDYNIDNIDNISWNYFNENRNELLQLISFNEYKNLIKNR